MDEQECVDVHDATSEALAALGRRHELTPGEVRMITDEAEAAKQWQHSLDANVDSVWGEIYSVLSHRCGRRGSVVRVGSEVAADAPLLVRLV
jgi:tetrahydromethanopterin S-methyltransferase subunit G